MANKGKKDAAGTDDVKNLLILLLMKLGSTSEEIGAALNVHPSRVRQILPPAKVKKLNLE